MPRISFDLTAEWTPPGESEVAHFTVRRLGTFAAIEFSERLSSTGPHHVDDEGKLFVPREAMDAIYDLAVTQVTGWDLLDSKGDPLPCTEETKRLVFGMVGHEGAAFAVLSALMPARTNGDARTKASGGGSASGSLTPASTAGSITTTETGQQTTAPPTDAASDGGATG